MKVRQLTPAGITRARDLLAEWRSAAPVDHNQLHDLLESSRYSEPFRDSLEVTRQPVATRRDAAILLVELLGDITVPIADDYGLWSWLGMFFLPEMPPGPRTSDDAYVFLGDESTTELRRAYQRRYRHMLRGAYLLFRQHDESAAFLLDRPISSFGTLEDRLFSDFRAFNSKGVVHLAIRLYTREKDTLKRGYSDDRTPGSVRHLLRILNQMERVYDVYGMSSEALMRILPEDFSVWQAAS